MAKEEITENHLLTVLKEKQMEQNFAQDVKKGLSNAPRTIPSRYFYDEKGSHLFEEIMKLPEYYLTNCEWNIFRTHKQDILDLVKEEKFCLVDLGAGDGKKTRVLIDHFLNEKADFSYQPIDISGDILEELLAKLKTEKPQLQASGIVAEYFDALEWMKKHVVGRKLVLFMGSNIGNFDKRSAMGFLRGMWEALDNNDLLLIGIDLKKEPRRILRAYDDSQGVTAEFNYNLLHRINAELQGNFDLKKWQHYATYDPMHGITQSFLISLEDQEVEIGALAESFHFDAYEAVHTEYSVKYSMKEVENMAGACGFRIRKNLFCKEAPFVDSIWQVVK